MPINLLPLKEFEEGPFWQKAFKWATGVGRIIIISTEIVVLTVFLSRFFLDRKITDLSEAIKTKQTIIRTTGDLEDRFRKAQDRLSSLELIKTKQKQYSQTLTALTNRIPKETTFNHLKIKQNSLFITTTTKGGVGFIKLLSALLEWPAVSQIALRNAQLATEKTGLQISLEITINPEAYAYQWPTKKR